MLREYAPWAQRHISTNATPPSNQGLASLKNSLTGRRLCTVSLPIRQPLGPGFFARELLFPPVRRPGLAAPLPPRLRRVLTPTFALFLLRPAAAAVVAELALGLVPALDAGADFVADFVAGLVAGWPADLIADLVADLAPDFLADLAPALTLPPRLPLPAFAPPGSAATPDLVSGQRALRRCAALRAEALRDSDGRRRSGAAPGEPAAWPRASAMAVATSSIGAIPSTVLSAPLPA